MTCIPQVIESVTQKNPGEDEFIQSVKEVLSALQPLLAEEDKYCDPSLLLRMVEPERILIFRVPWQDDQNEVRVNRGYRVEFNSAIGPYKGGLRFHPSVNLSILKFLGFEQTFKNALTTLPLGGGKGGSDFDPRSRSDAEVMRFCQSYMTELSRHIGARTDIPAGDIGVSPREIGFLFGQYKRIRNEFTGALTGKGLNWGGSLVRTEATGYGCVYFAREMLATHDDELAGKRCAISGAGNVAQHTAEKLIELGAVVLSLSDSDGTIYAKDGLLPEQLIWIKRLKNEWRGRIREAAEKFKGIEYLDGKKPWDLSADCAFPCATQNELGEHHARMLLKNGCWLVCEGANMPCTAEAVHCFREQKILYAPGKAANAGGVAVSGLEMSQNQVGETWSAYEVDHRLEKIMKAIHSACRREAKCFSYPDDYVAGANIAGFLKVADAMIEQGCV